MSHEVLNPLPRQNGAENHPVIFPPDESIWRKYSANHEFPLSTLASIVLHLFVLMLMVAFGAMVFHWSSDHDLTIEPVQFAEDGGGGGRPEGGANPETLTPGEEPGKVQDTEVTDAALLPGIGQIITRNTPNPSGDEVSKTFDRDFREPKPDPSKQIGPQGRGGDGDGGGLGKGHGPVKGDKSGIGTNRKPMRTDRWAIAISYFGGRELYEEWAEMEAVILIPDGKNENGKAFYRVYYDLTARHPKPKLETAESVETRGRIWFTDRNPDSVRNLSAYLGYSVPPPFIAFFIPKDLEEELMRKELAYRKKTEEQLQGWETVFEVNRVGDKFVARVLRQEKKK